VLLSWVGISMFESDSASVPATAESTVNSQAPSRAPVSAPNEPSPAATVLPPPKPAAETAATRSAKAEPAVREQPAAPPSPINEVLPDVSQSALNTIRGTIRVSVRVTVGKDGTVLAATADEPGPSRYFQRHAVAASKKWTFTPANSEEQRIMLVKFYFTRTGASADASPPQ
jgi:TonB family protein